jgi:2-dehydropantoate 2-reductase
MRVCIVGAGALGGFVGARLALAGLEPTLIDRDRQLTALQSEGVRLIGQDGFRQTARAFRATSSFDEAGPHDLVILAVKAYDLPNVAPFLSSLFHDHTIVLPMQNGIPWWYFEGHGGGLEGVRLQSIDPDGLMQHEVAGRRTIGCVAYPAASLESPGTVRHIEGDRFAIGELDGTISDRLESVCCIFEAAGLRARAITDIRAEIWLKALGSVSFNPISTLTGATMAGICRQPETRALVRRMMEEAQTIAGKLGVTIRKTIDERIAGAQAVGEHRTSMLQDFEAGRPLETGALIGSVSELGRLTATPTPSIDAVHACLQLRVESGRCAIAPQRAFRELLAVIGTDPA